MECRKCLNFTEYTICSRIILDKYFGDLTHIKFMEYKMTFRTIKVIFQYIHVLRVVIESITRLFNRVGGISETLHWPIWVRPRDHKFLDFMNLFGNFGCTPISFCTIYDHYVTRSHACNSEFAQKW